MIQPIENLKAESDVLAFSREEVLKQPHIPVLESGLIENISAPLVGEGSLRWLENVDAGLERIPRVVCAEPGRLRDLSIHDPTRSESVVGVPRITASGPDAGKIVVGLNRNWRSRLQLSDFRNLPTTKQPASPSLCVSEER